MKDIPYNGDLSKDIYYLDNPFNLKEEAIFKGIFNFSILTIVGLFAFSFGVIPFNLISLLIYIAGCLGVNTLYTIIHFIPNILFWCLWKSKSKSFFQQ